MRKIKPQNGYVQVSMKEQDTSTGGIVVSIGSNKDILFTVVAIADDVENVKIGDSILAQAPLQAFQFPTSGETFHFTHKDKIIGVFEE